MVMSGCVDMAPQLGEQCVPSSVAIIFSSVTRLPPWATAMSGLE